MSSAQWTQRAALVTAVAAAVVVVLLGAWYGAPILFALFASVLFAVFLRGLSDPLARITGWRDGVALAVVVVALTAVTVGGGAAAAPSISEQGRELAKELPAAVAALRERVERATDGVEKQVGQGSGGGASSDPAGGDGSGGGSGGASGGGEAQQQPLAKVAGAASRGDLLTVATTTFGSVLTALGTAVFIAFVGLYLAVSPRTYVNGALALLPASWRADARELFARIGHVLRFWLLGQVLSMIYVGVGVAVGLALFDVPLAFALGVLAALSQFVPNIGPILAGVPGVLLAASQGGPMVLQVCAVYFVVQFSESWFVTPHIQKRATDMPPALLLATQALMSMWFGLPGLAMAAPLTAVGLVVAERFRPDDPVSDRAAPRDPAASRHEPGADARPDRRGYSAGDAPA